MPSAVEFSQVPTSALPVLSWLLCGRDCLSQASTLLVDHALSASVVLLLPYQPVSSKGPGQVFLIVTPTPVGRHLTRGLACGKCWSSWSNHGEGRPPKGLWPTPGFGQGLGSSQGRCPGLEVATLRSAENIYPCAYFMCFGRA